jgi:agmatinase
MIHVDAHCDTSGLRHDEVPPWRTVPQAVLDGVLDPRRVIQIGIAARRNTFGNSLTMPA